MMINLEKTLAWTWKGGKFTTWQLIWTLRWKEALWEGSVLPKNTASGLQRWCELMRHRNVAIESPYISQTMAHLDLNKWKLFLSFLTSSLLFIYFLLVINILGKSVTLNEVDVRTSYDVDIENGKNMIHHFSHSKQDFKPRYESLFALRRANAWSVSFENLKGDQFMISIQLMIPNYYEPFWSIRYEWNIIDLSFAG